MAEALGFDPRTHAPEVLFLAVPASDVCNYRCRHCHIWLQDRNPRALASERRRELVSEFADLNPHGTVVLPGGEVLLDLDEFLAIAGACRERGLGLFLLTNGSGIRSQEDASVVLESGVTHVAVSLDGPTAEFHDYTRGVVGAFAETTGAIRRLVAERARRRSSVVLQSACVLFRENLPRFVDFVELCRELGVDHVDFQLLARTFANRHRSKDVFFEKHFWHADADKVEAVRLFGEILDRYADDPLLVKKPSDLAWIRDYVADPDYRMAQPVCGAHQRNLHVDAEGNVALCFNTAAILDQPFVGSVVTSTLGELWRGEKAASDRGVMDRCTLNCGALNCHRRGGEVASA